MEYHVSPVSKQRVFSYAVAALVIGTALGGAMWNIGGVYFLKAHAMTKFSSQQELVDFLRSTTQGLPQSLIQKFQYMLQNDRTRIEYFASSPTFDSLAKGAAESSAVPDYSTTNIQVEGVDEADTVKTDGAYLYIASGSSVYIVRAYPPGEANVLSKMEFKARVAGLFINGDKLVVFLGESSSGPVFILRIYPPIPVVRDTSLLVYDVLDRTKPTLQRNVTVDGSYFGSRMIGDYVYAVVNKVAELNKTEVSLPVITSGKATTKVEATSVYHSDLPDYYHFFTVIIAVNVKDSQQNPTIETFLQGATSCIYVSTENIYLTARGTTIHKIGIKSGQIQYLANNMVPGYVLNQYSMDEYSGYFRIATSNGTSSNVYILDRDLKIVGRLEDLAPGENMYSARFMGEKGYLVTFKKVDPLFVVDLKDPSNPKVLGKLKIPGYSDYLHPYDENHLIGLGKDTFPSEQGDFSWYQGVKLSLFDVSNVSQPKEIASLVIGDRGTDSPALKDAKAFLFSRTKNLLVIPILLAQIDKAKYPQGYPPYTYGDYVYQGAYVFNLTVEQGFVLRGRITHLDNSTELAKSGDYFSSVYSVSRALYIEKALYTISQGKVKMNSLTDLSELGRVKLP